MTANDGENETLIIESHSILIGAAVDIDRAQRRSSGELGLAGERGCIFDHRQSRRHSSRIAAVNAKGGPRQSSNTHARDGAAVNK
jgi:hypothetical protein